MAGPGLPVNIDTTYTDSGTDASVKLHQQHHDLISEHGDYDNRARDVVDKNRYDSGLLGSCLMTRGLLGVATPPSTDIHFDASTVGTAYASIGTQTVTHSASASARAAVVMIEQNTNVADQVSSVSYGGVAMTRLRFDSEHTESGATYIYCLDGITSGTKDVTMVSTGTVNKQLTVATMTSPLRQP